jgi:hypothetical protein
MLPIHGAYSVLVGRKMKQTLAIGICVMLFGSTVLAINSQNEEIQAVEISDNPYSEMDIIAQWHFDEGSGQWTQDSSGNGNHGVLGSINGTDDNDPSWANGLIGKALLYDGDDYSDMGKQVSEMVASYPEYTFEMWFQPDIWNPHGGILSNYNGSTDSSFQFYAVGNPGMYEWTWDSKNDKWGGYSLDYSICPGTWSQLVVTKGYYERIRVLNGYDRARNTYPHDNTKLRDSSANTFIGNEGNPLLGMAGFHGFIDEVTIWSRSFTLSEIQQRYYDMLNGPETATATGPQGADHNPKITIIYNWTGTPTAVDLYYSNDTGCSWNYLGTDTSIDGSYDWEPESNPAPNPSKYYWIANAKGGADDVGIPADGTVPEAGPFNWKTFDLNTVSPPRGDGSGYWTFVSVPLTVSGDITTIFNDALYGDGGTTWDYAMWYDANDAADPWKSYMVNKPESLNDWVCFDNTMGIWLHIISNGGDGVLTAGEGIMPVSTTIYLCAGWNMVGYPTSYATMTVADALSGIGVDKVEVFDPSDPYMTKEVGPTYIMMPGEAYWVHVLADAVWVVDW